MTSKAKTNLDDWAKTEVAVKPPQCRSCRTPYVETIRELLEAVSRNKAYAIGRKAVYTKLKEVHPDYPNTYKAFENHLYEHEAALWAKAMGRGNS